MHNRSALRRPTTSYPVHHMVCGCVSPPFSAVFYLLAVTFFHATTTPTIYGVSRAGRGSEIALFEYPLAIYQSRAMIRLPHGSPTYIRPQAMFNGDESFSLD